MTQTPLIAMIVIGIGLAFVFGTIANRLKISPIAGYLMAGVAVGPFTPGFIGDPGLALQLADIGVILLMFGVGLHFSLRDLLSLRKALIPAIMAQIAISTCLGAPVAWFMALLYRSRARSCCCARCRSAVCSTRIVAGWRWVG